jgi:hypothetical protein
LTWYLRQHPKVRALKFKEGVKRQVSLRAETNPGSEVVVRREGEEKGKGLTWYLRRHPKVRALKSRRESSGRWA